MDEDKRDKILINCLVAMFIGALLLLTVTMISEERHSVRQQEKVKAYRTHHVERPRYIEDTVVTPEFEDKGEQHTYLGRGDSKPALAFGDGDVGMYEDPDRGFRFSHANERGEGLITCNHIGTVMFAWRDGILIEIDISVASTESIPAEIINTEDNRYDVYYRGNRLCTITPHLMVQ